MKIILLILSIMLVSNQIEATTKTTAKKATIKQK